MEPAGITPAPPAPASWEESQLPRRNRYDIRQVDPDPQPAWERRWERITNTITKYCKMCLPCIPWSTVELDDHPAAVRNRERKKNGQINYLVAWDAVHGRWVQVATDYEMVPVRRSAGYVAPPPPVFAPVPQGPRQYAPLGMALPDPVFDPNVNPQYLHAHPGFWPPYNSMYGHTPSEIIQQQLATAEAQGKYKGDIKPADDDPRRFYWVREHDDTWTQRNRMTIDSDGFGEVIWYVHDNEFYAVRKSKK